MTLRPQRHSFGLLVHERTSETVRFRFAGGPRAGNRTQPVWTLPGSWRQRPTIRHPVILVEAKIGANCDGDQVSTYVRAQQRRLAEAGLESGATVVLVPESRVGEVGSVLANGPFCFGHRDLVGLGTTGRLLEIRDNGRARKGAHSMREAHTRLVAG